MKVFFKITLFLSIVLSILFGNSVVYSAPENLDVGIKKTSNNIKNEHLNSLKTENDFDVRGTGGESIYNTLVTIAKSLKNVIFYITTFYFIIIVIRLIFSEENDEAVNKFKKGIFWISIGLIITQIAYSFVRLLYGENISEGLANNFNQEIIYPLIRLLETGASFVFIAIAIYAFFRMISSNGDEEKVKSGRMSILYSIIGFIVVKFARAVVDSTYGKIDCNDKTIFGIIEVSFNECSRKADLSESSQIVVTIIDWMNSLIGIVIIILIIYSGVQVILNVGDEERLKKAKNSIVFISVGLFLLFVNYLILTFFIIPESVI